MPYTALQIKVGRALDKARRRFFPKGTVIEFLEPNPKKDGYVVIETVREWWWLEKNNFFRNFDIMLVERTPFAETVRRATHVRTIVPDIDDTGTVYRLDRKPPEAPQGADPLWRLRADRVLTDTSGFGR